jgi:hypothetical protein
MLTKFLPLPGGEGRGEGERKYTPSVGSLYIHLLNNMSLLTSAATRSDFISGSFQESQIRCGKPADVGKNGAEIGVVHSEPGGNGREVLVDSGRRNPAASAGVVRAADGKRRKFSVSFAAEHGPVGEIGRARAADDEMVAAPAVVTPLPVAWERAPEIAGGECRDVVLQSELLHRLLEDQQRLAQFREQICVRADDDVIRRRIAVIRLAAVQIVSAHLAEEYLPLHAEAIGRAARGAMAGFDHSRDHFQLGAQRRGKVAAAVWRGDLRGKRNGPIIRRRRVGDGVVQERAGIDAVRRHARVSLRLHVRVRQPKDIRERRQTRAGHAVERNRAAGGNGILRNDVADFEGVRARQ